MIRKTRRSGFGFRAGLCVCLLAGLMIAATVGCGDAGPELGTVSGTVTLDAQPLADAYVEFQPAEGRASGGMTDAAGAYSLDFVAGEKGALPGEHTVRITTENVLTDPETGEPIDSPERAPAKYNQNTELKATVTTGSNTIDFALTSE